MAFKVWIIGNKGEQRSEEFTDKQECIDYAIDQSQLFNNMVTFRLEGRNLVTYENGRIVVGSRAKELQLAAQEIIEYGQKK